MSHFTDFTGYVLFIITSFLAGVESTDQCLLNSKVLSCFSGVIMSIRSFFLLRSQIVLLGQGSSFFLEATRNSKIRTSSIGDFYPITFLHSDLYSCLFHYMTRFGILCFLKNHKISVVIISESKTSIQ